MTKKLEDWLFSDGSPRDLYQLLGLPRFEVDHAAIATAVRSVSRKLLQYERHSKANVAQQATKLQRQSAQIDRTVRDVHRLREAHRDILGELADDWNRQPKGSRGPLPEWLAAQEVHPERVASVAAAISTGNFDAHLADLDPFDVQSLVDMFDEVDNGDAAVDEPGEQLPGDVPTPPQPAPALPVAIPSRPVSVAVPTPIPQALPQAVAPWAAPAARLAPLHALPPANAGAVRRDKRLPLWSTCAALIVALLGATMFWVYRDRTDSPAVVAVAEPDVTAASTSTAVSAPALDAASPSATTTAPPAPKLVVPKEGALGVDDTLDVTFEVENDAPGVTVSVHGALPPGATYNEHDRRLRWKPEAGGSRKSTTYPLTLQLVADARIADSIPWTIQLRVPNRPPSVATERVTVVANQTLEHQVIAVDPDGDALRYELLNGPPSTSIEATTGRLTWRPEVRMVGEHQLMIRVTDAGTPPQSATGSLLVTFKPSTEPNAKPNTPAPATPTGPATSPPPAGGLNPQELTRQTPLIDVRFDSESPAFRRQTTQWWQNRYEDGRFVAERTPEKEGSVVTSLGPGPPIQLSDFACEIRARIRGTSKSEWGVVYSGPNSRLCITSSQSLTFARRTIATPQGLLQPVDRDNTLLLIVRGGQTSVYLNGTPVRIPADSNLDNPGPMNVGMWFGGAVGAKAEFEYFKLWRLEGGATASAAGGIPLERVENTLSMYFSGIRAGTFLMGSPESEFGRQRSETQHEVTISRDFYIATHEVTAEQYLRVMPNNARILAMLDRTALSQPAVNVSHEEARTFCRLLGTRPDERAAGRTYRLPTEAEWEYACRAGTTTPYHTGESPPSGLNTPGSPAPILRVVGTSPPNAFGLFDMHGNASEWCEDRFVPYKSEAATDPVFKLGSAAYVVRGGCFRDPPQFQRSAARGNLPSKDPRFAKTPFIGFRVVMERKEDSSK